MVEGAFRASLPRKLGENLSRLPPSTHYYYSFSSSDQKEVRLCICNREAEPENQRSALELLERIQSEFHVTNVCVSASRAHGFVAASLPRRMSFIYRSRMANSVQTRAMALPASLVYSDKDFRVTLCEEDLGTPRYYCNLVTDRTSADGLNTPGWRRQDPHEAPPMAHLQHSICAGEVVQVEVTGRTYTTVNLEDADVALLVRARDFVLGERHLPRCTSATLSNFRAESLSLYVDVPAHMRHRVQDLINTFYQFNMQGSSFGAFINFHGSNINNAELMASMGALAESTSTPVSEAMLVPIEAPPEESEESTVDPATLAQPEPVLQLAAADEEEEERSESTVDPATLVQPEPVPELPEEEEERREPAADLATLPRPPLVLHLEDEVEITEEAGFVIFAAAPPVPGPSAMDQIFASAVSLITWNDFVETSAPIDIPPIVDPEPESDEFVPIAARLRRKRGRSDSEPVPEPPRKVARTPRRSSPMRSLVIDLSNQTEADIRAQLSQMEEVSAVASHEYALLDDHFHTIVDAIPPELNSMISSF